MLDLSNDMKITERFTGNQIARIVVIVQMCYEVWYHPQSKNAKQNKHVFITSSNHQRGQRWIEAQNKPELFAVENWRYMNGKSNGSGRA